MTLLVPEYLQAKSYAAIKDRYATNHLKAGIYEGPVNEADYIVSQRAAGANMSVDVAAGSCWVQGDDTARQGAYHLVNDGVVNVAVSAAHAILPRIDIVVARIYDSAVVGTSDTPTIEVVAGTPTSGAQSTDPEAANYRLGAAALPNGALHLADVQVDAAVTSIVNAKIWDKRVRRRGASIIATEESRTNTAYGLLTTPDRVRNVMLPADGRLFISYEALVKQSVGSAGAVAIFIGANQLKKMNGAGAPTTTSTDIGSSANDYQWIFTAFNATSGMDQMVYIVGVGDASTISTGLVGGQTIEVWAAAGTYDISVRYKASSGSVTAKERKLWVETHAFDQVSF